MYDAVTKIAGRYEPYHDFTVAVAPGASLQAAVASATRTILDNYLPDQRPAVDTEYAAYIATLSGDVADGVAVGEAAANDVIPGSDGDRLAWRPITAIRNADKDGNPDTTADPAWAPLLATPNHPEYPSQHGCFTSAFTDSLAAALHTRHLDANGRSPRARPSGDGGRRGRGHRDPLRTSRE